MYILGVSRGFAFVEFLNISEAIRWKELTQVGWHSNAKFVFFFFFLIGTSESKLNQLIIISSQVDIEFKHDHKLQILFLNFYYLFRV